MKNATKSLAIAALIIALSAGFGLLFERTTPKAMAAPAPTAVVILEVGESFIMFGTTAIKDSASSAAAPDVSAGSNPAQALADLLTAGFRIEHAAAGQNTVTYTLVR